MAFKVTSTCNQAAKSHSHSASSQLTARDPIWNSELIHNDFSVKPTFSKYDLIDLLKSKKCIKKGKRSDEYLLQWINTIYNRCGGCELTHSYSEVKAFQMLQPFTSSVKIKPDVAIVCHNLPVMGFDVHSSKYNDTLAKCAANTIDQLRLFRSLTKPVLNKISNFVFPKEGVKEWVTKVDVEWVNMKFQVQFTCLDKEDVEPQVHEILTSQHDIVSRIGPINENESDLDFVTLGNNDLELLEKELDVPHKKLKQIHSTFSVIVESDDFVYKIMPRDQEARYLLGLIVEANETREVARHMLVLPTRVKIVLTHSVFVYQRQPHHPLSKNEAKRCLYELIMQTKEALDQLHEIGFAHLDVRLPNICFDCDGTLKLIDFDRTRPNGTLPSIGYSNAFMYQLPNDAVTGASLAVQDLDFKQLGLMAFSILNSKTQTKLMEADVASLGTHKGFLWSLIFECRYT